jgi:hypothetical protein
MVVCDDRGDKNRTLKIYDALDKICVEFDLSRPIWLDATVNDFLKTDKARFNKDDFVDDIDFDYLEIQVIEEDEVE